jgi:hypothetical protein
VCKGELSLKARTGLVVLLILIRYIAVTLKNANPENEKTLSYFCKDARKKREGMINGFYNDATLPILSNLFFAIVLSNCVNKAILYHKSYSLFFLIYRHGLKIL